MNKITAIVMSVVASALFIAPVFAQDTPTPTPKPQLDPACMVTAVDKRDTSLINAFDTRSAQYRKALDTRKEALKAAWALTDIKDRNTALRVAWNNYKWAVRDARHAWAKDRNAAWQQFRTDAIQCHGSADSQFRGLDSSL
ncbi:MAG TPA: hypothetical protein VEK36_01360 [Candidatus Paceibacterota bacterium]|nr:hypothetical protein [Candidatus Paceibacterota bacterium]